MVAGTDGVTWEAPGPGEWWPIVDHMPKPVSHLFVELFSVMAGGSTTAAKLYGRPLPKSTQAPINGWLYWGPAADAEPDDLDAMDAAAKETIETCRWREEARAWIEDERPAAVAGNLALQDESFDGMDDAQLADHLRRAIHHYETFAPLHFSHQGFAYAAGLLITACDEWGLEEDIPLALMSGASSASLAARDHLERIGAALRAAGVQRVATLDEVRHASKDAGAALDAYLRMHGNRLLENRDLVDPTLIERPYVIVSTINAALGGGPFAVAAKQTAVDAAAIRERVPEVDRERFDTLLHDARSLYGIGDDDEGICFLWPLGLIRRAVLEAGRRLVARGALHDATHLLDARSAEIDGLLRGDARTPTADDLRARSDARRRAAALTPPAPVGEPLATPSPPVDLPPHAQRLHALAQRRWSGHATRGDGELRGFGVGDVVYRGRAACITTELDGIDRLQPGDVLVAVSTHPGFNAVFPIVGAAVTEEGGVMCHAALLARELGLPAVVGVKGIARIRDGDIVEVDPLEGTVRIIG